MCQYVEFGGTRLKLRRPSSESVSGLQRDTVKRWGSVGEEVLALRAFWVADWMSGWLWVFCRERCEDGFQVFSQDGWW